MAVQVNYPSTGSMPWGWYRFFWVPLHLITRIYAFKVLQRLDRWSLPNHSHSGNLFKEITVKRFYTKKNGELTHHILNERSTDVALKLVAPCFGLFSFVFSRNEVKICLICPPRWFIQFVSKHKISFFLSLARNYLLTGIPGGNELQPKKVCRPTMQTNSDHNYLWPILDGLNRRANFLHPLPFHTLLMLQLTHLHIGILRSNV